MQIFILFRMQIHLLDKAHAPAKKQMQIHLLDKVHAPAKKQTWLSSIKEPKIENWLLYTPFFFVKLTKCAENSYFSFLSVSNSKKNSNVLFIVWIALLVRYALLWNKCFDYFMIVGYLWMTWIS